MKKNSSNSSKGILSNTKQIPPSKNWVFTLNNYKQSDIDFIINIDKNIVPKYIFQEEIGESGTPHLQGYLQFKDKKRPLSIFKDDLKGAHWEKCRHIAASIKYCKKGKTRIQGTIPYARDIKIPYIIKIDEMTNWEKGILDIINEEPDDRKINWIWEPTGCTGKTTFAKWIFLNYDDVIVLSGRGSDMKNGIVMYEKTNHKLPKIVIINVPRCNLDFLSYTGIEEIKDMFFFSGKYEGGMICGANPHLLIFANEPPKDNKISEDRWNILNIE